MKSNNPSKRNDEINLKEIILTVWNERFLIIFFSLIFLISGYIYGDKKIKIYQSNIIVREIPTEALFGSYYSQVTKDINLEMIDYNRLLNLNIASTNNMIKFLNQNDEFSEFRSFLKKKNVNLQNYFSNKIKHEKNDENLNYKKYSLKFTEPFPAQKFLNDYIIYVSQITELEIKKILKEILKTELEIYKKSLDVANILNYEIPSDNDYYESFNIPLNETYLQFYYLYPLGSKVLAYNINYLEQKIDKLDNLKLDYKLIHDKASSPTLSTQTTKTIALFALLLGLFFSIIIIFIKSILKT